MKTKEIDILNVLLIVVALALAFNIPFGLFVFSYAFLGPLHYLTEINWLKEKKYFVKNTAWIWILVVLGVVLSATLLTRLSSFSKLDVNSILFKAGTFLNNAADEILLISLLFAIGLIYFKKKWHLLLFLAVSILVALPILHYFPIFALAIAVLVPTLIHVYLFTLFFMVFGTLNSKSTPGIIAIVLLVLVPFIIGLSHINPEEYYSINEYTRNAIEQSGFGTVVYYVGKVFSGGETLAYLSAIGIKIQIFIAFAYTYHYLNWFSKTSIIGWGNNMSKKKVRTVAVIWLASIGLYLYNFKVGFIVLGALSFVHVFLEFPLNMTSIKGIFNKMRLRFSTQP